MNQEDVQKLSNAANAKITLLKNDFFKYFMRAIMAGFFIVVAMIFSNVVGNVFSGAEEPAWGKFLGALVFSIAVLLISLVGGELFTGNNLVMAFGAFDKKISWGDAAKVWVVSYIGNFVGCLILSLIFVWAGASGTADYFAGFIVRVAKDQMGIGGDDSWGARTHEEYLLKTDKKMEFSFVFKGL